MKLKPFSAALVVVLATGALAACGGPPAAEEDSVLRIGLSATPPGFDPIAGTYGFATQAVYDGLLEVEQDVDNPQPWLAESFSYNEDHTVLTLKIRDDVDFIDGEHLNAEVVKQNLDLQRTEGSAVTYFAAIEEVVVTDEYTVELRLSHADQSLMLVMNQSIASPAALEDRESLAVTPVGSGPYILESNTDTEYVFVRNEAYWNPEAYPFDRLEMTVMPDLTARLNALKSGQINFAQIDSATSSEAEASGFEYYAMMGQWVGLMFDRSGTLLPQLADERVRQAIAMSFDREGFNESVLNGIGDPSNQVGTTQQAGTGYYLPELANEHPYDVEAAKELLAEAGYPDGFDLTIPSTPWLAHLQPYVEQALGDIGIRVTWRDDADFWGSTFVTGIDPVYLMGGNYNEPAFIEENGLFNPWHITDAETQDLLATLRVAEGDDWLEARSRLTEKIFDETWFAILGHEPMVYAFDSSIDVQTPLWLNLKAIQVD